MKLYDFQQPAEDFEEAVAVIRERIQKARLLRQAVAIRISVPYQTPSGDFECLSAEVPPTKLGYQVEHE